MAGYVTTPRPVVSIAIEGYSGVSTGTGNATSYSGNHTPPASTDAVLILAKSRNFSSANTPTLTVVYNGVTISALVESYSTPGRGTDDIQVWVGVAEAPPIASNAWSITSATSTCAPYVEFFSLSGFSGHTPSLGTYKYQGSDPSSVLTWSPVLHPAYDGGLIICQAGMSQQSNTISSFGGSGYTDRHTGNSGSGTTQQLYSTTRSKITTLGDEESFSITFTGTSDTDIGGILAEIGYV